MCGFICYMRLHLYTCGMIQRQCTSSITTSTPHVVHQSPTATRPIKPTLWAGHHRPVIGPWSLASHSPPGNVVMEFDLPVTALKDFYVPAT